jgi:hypothetical protein
MTGKRLVAGLLDPFWIGRRPHLFDQGCRLG